MALATGGISTDLVIDHEDVRAKLVALHDAMVGDPFDDPVLGDDVGAELLLEDLIEMFGGWRGGKRVTVELYDESKMPPSDIEGFKVRQAKQDVTVTAYSCSDMHWIEGTKPSFTYPDRVDGSEYVWVEIWVPGSLTLSDLGETEPCNHWMVFEENHLGHRLYKPTKFETKDEAVAFARAVVAGWDARDDVHGDGEAADAAAQRKFEARR